MESFTLRPIGTVHRGVDIAAAPRSLATAAVSYGSMILQVPKNTVLVCADGTQINISIGGIGFDLLCPDAIHPPSTILINREHGMHGPWFACVSEKHPVHQKIVGVLFVDFPTAGPVIHAYVLYPTVSDNPHYGGWFGRTDDAVQYILYQCAPYSLRPHNISLEIGRH